VNYGTTGRNGYVRWYHGIVSLKVDIDWTKAGLRHIVLTYSQIHTRVEIFVDGVSQGTTQLCDTTRANS